MWEVESQRTRVRERMKLLLEAHAREIHPLELRAEANELLLRQGEPAERILLLIEGCVAIQLHQRGSEAHTIAVLEAEELLGEMGLFGSGLHAADVRVLDGPARLIAVDANQMLQAMLFDADLSVELLNLVSTRCLEGNAMVALLLDGIQAAHSGDPALLQETCTLLRRRHHAIAAAADKLLELQR